MKKQIRAALHSLPWYLGGSLLLTPLFLIPVFGFASMMLYVAYFSDQAYIAIPVGLIPGFLLWVVRQFIRAALWCWWQNHKALVAGHNN
jgi:hypothetical protein